MTDSRKLIKIATAGSVDDGKSTLIGRLLYETKSLATDKLEAIERSSKAKGYDYMDFSLATDGLVAEREQGITIDVAHIYFSTDYTNFIVADTPGHVEYTRNMVTGASTSQVAIILIDARKGVIEQTLRHFFIANMLRLDHVIVAVNKMDLVSYDEASFLKIKTDFQNLATKSDFNKEQITFIPVAALHGDNITSKSDKMPWYQGKHLLSYLESLELSQKRELPARFLVQYVIRPKTEAYHDFRGFSGRLYGGKLKVGDAITVLPSLQKSTISSIMFFEETYEEAEPGASITITLADEINTSRGDMIVKTQSIPPVSQKIEAVICQLNSRALKAGTKYIMQHGVNRILVRIEKIVNRIHTNFTGTEEVDDLKLNDIGTVTFLLSKPIHAEQYASNKANGSFILIDEQTYDTASVGFIV